MYLLVIGGWAVGMGLYIFLNRYNQYNNRNYYDVKANIKRFKSVRDQVNGVNKKVM